LTLKASPAASDEVIIWDVAGAVLKKATVSGVGASAGVSSIAGNTGAFTLTYPISNSTNAIVYVGPTSSGRLTFVSATAIKFAPYNGDLIKINGTIFQIPAAGIAGVANTSVFVNGVGGSNLAATTFYYVYAFNNSGTITADFRTDGNGHLPSDTAGNIGTEVRVSAGTTKDDTRTLIGMVRTNGSSQFADSLAQRFVVSWFNRRTIGTSASFSTTRTTTSTTLVELNTEIRNEFLTWNDEAVLAFFAGGGFSSTTGGGATVSTDVTYDGATGEMATLFDPGTVNLFYPVAAHHSKNGLAEGYHFATVAGKVVSGTGSWNGSLRLAIRG
jgi:hypothetical protein